MQAGFEFGDVGAGFGTGAGVGFGTGAGVGFGTGAGSGFGTGDWSVHFPHSRHTCIASLPVCMSLSKWHQL